MCHQKGIGFARWRSEAELQDCKRGIRMFGIPAGSPDLNPVENIFHLMRKQLKDDALAKKRDPETYAEFSKHVAETISKFSPDIITKTIDSMEKCISMIIAAKRECIKY